MDTPAINQVRDAQKKCWLTLTLLAGAFVGINTIFLFYVAGRVSIIADLVAISFGLTAQMWAFGRRFYPSPLQRDAASAQQAHALLDGVWSRAKDDLALLEGNFSKDRIAWQGAFAAGILVVGVVLQYALARKGAQVTSISVGTAALLLAFCVVPWMLYAPLVMSWMTIVVTTASHAGAFTPLTLAACLAVGIESCLFAMISERMVTATCFADLKSKKSSTSLRWLQPLVQLIVLSCLTFALLPTTEKQKKRALNFPTKQKTVLPSPRIRRETVGPSGEREGAIAGSGAGSDAGTSGGTVATPGAGTKGGGTPGTGGGAGAGAGTGATAGNDSGSGRKPGTAGGSGEKAGAGTGPRPSAGNGAGAGAPEETGTDAAARPRAGGAGAGAGSNERTEPPGGTVASAPKRNTSGSKGQAASSVVTKTTSPRKVPETDWKKLLILVLGLTAVSATAFFLLKKKRRPERDEQDDRDHPNPDEDEVVPSAVVTKRDLADALRAHASGKMRGDDRSLVVHLYNLTLQHLKARGLPRKRSQTPDEYARLSGAMIRSEGVELHRVTNLFGRVLYGRVDPRPEEIEAYVQSVRKLAEKV